MKKSYYHATTNANARSIREEGIKSGYDGLIYLTDKLYDSAKFLVARGTLIEDIMVFEIPEKYLKKGLLALSNDHSEKFFGCKAYAYGAGIPLKVMKKCNVYRFVEGGEV